MTIIILLKNGQEYCAASLSEIRLHHDRISNEKRERDKKKTRLVNVETNTGSR